MLARTKPELAVPALWVGVEAVGGSILSLGGLLLIAGLIGPVHLGLSAIALGIVQAANFFPDTLFHDAIIQRHRLTTSQVGSAFWSVITLSAVLGVFIAAFASLAGKFYDQAQLSPLLWALSPSPLFTAAASVQTARLRRAMRFRALAAYAMASRGMATVAGVALALAGYGAWAIIAQYGLAPASLALMLILSTRWRFSRHFSLRDAREIGGFACTRTAAHFVEVWRGPVFFALLGQYLSLQVLGQVNLAFRLIASLTSVLCTATTRLFLPKFSRSRPGVLAECLWEASSMTAVFLVPVYVILALTGNDLVRLLATGQWQGMHELIPWLCIAGIVVILQTPMATALLAAGRPGLLLYGSSAVLAVLLVEILVVAPSTGVQSVICWALAPVAVIPVYAAVARLSVGLSIRDQCASLIPAMVIAALTAGGVLAVGESAYSESQLVKVVSEIFAGGGVYLLGVSAFLLMFYRRAGRIGRRRQIQETP